MTILDSVLLRKIEEHDLPALYTFRNDRQVVQHLGGFSTGYSLADLRDWLNRHRNREDEVLYAVASRSDNACIGHVGLYGIDHRVRKAEFGILIGDVAWQGKGVGEAVTREMLRLGFLELNLNRIHLTVLATNARAIRLYEKVGFCREGLLRSDQYRDGAYVDSIVMGILRCDWCRRG